MADSTLSVAALQTKINNMTTVLTGLLTALDQRIAALGEAGEGGGSALSATQLLELIKTVDGPDSGLNAQNLAGLSVADLRSLWTQAINNVIDGAPEGLQTLAGLASAIGGDVNFSNNVQRAYKDADIAVLQEAKQYADGAGGGGTATPGQILAALLGVDGAGSGLDADLFDGMQRVTMEYNLRAYTDQAIAGLASTDMKINVATIPPAAEVTLDCTVTQGFTVDATATTAITLTNIPEIYGSKIHVLVEGSGDFSWTNPINWAETGEPLADGWTMFEIVSLPGKGLYGTSWTSDTITTQQAFLLAAPYEKWENFYGSSFALNGVVINGTGRSLTPLPEAGDAVDNPPVNGYTVLNVGNDFSITTVLDLANKGRAKLSFYGEIPMVKDEWRAEPNSFTMEFVGTTINFSSFNGVGAQFTGSSPLPPDPLTTVVIQRLNNTFTVNVNGSEIFNSVQLILATPTVYVGLFEANPGASFVVQSITSDALNNGSVSVTSLAAKPQAQTSTSLRAYATQYYPSLKIGSSVATYPLTMDLQYETILGREFSAIVPENALKFEFIQPAQGLFVFDESDLITRYAGMNGQAVHGHALVGIGSTPKWLWDYAETASAAEIQQTMITHIQTVMGRYKSAIKSWDVINHPFNNELAPGLRPSVWFNALGEQYVTVALTTARGVDPTAKLFINETDCAVAGEKQDALYTLIVDLQAAGVPIDGVGLEVHEILSTSNNLALIGKAELLASIQRFMSLGLEVRISAVDIATADDTASAALAQGDYYVDYLEAAIEAGATAYILNGFTDRWSDLQAVGDYTGYGNGLIYDETYAAKSAYNALKQRLQNTADLYGYILTDELGNTLTTEFDDSIATQYEEA